MQARDAKRTRIAHNYALLDIYAGTVRMLQTLRHLETLLPDTLSKDRQRFATRLRFLRRDYTAGKAVAEAIAELTLRVQDSVAAVQHRADSVPPLDYPDLPVSARRDEIIAAIGKHQVVVICGETGSGKTTQLPKLCLAAERGKTGLIGHTQPRRIAARSVAARIAEELKTPLGGLVGWKVRFNDHTKRETLVKLMTDGILLAELQTDRFLSAYDTLIIDEAHERSLNIDFLLGYLKLLLAKRADLKLIITSATIDPQRFSRHFGDAPIVMVSGRTYPVEVRYRPLTDQEDLDETDRTWQHAIVDAVDELIRERRGDVLVFLSGEREIRETAETLRKHGAMGYEILPLYSRLSAAEQDKVFHPSGRSRVILTTNVAETSLTVPGIRSVIDAGYARISRYSSRSRLQRLPIEKISRASANQRAGRCGRLAPGVCIRLYGEDDYHARAEFTDPEIQRTNLAAVILQMAALQLGDVSAFPFVDPPDERQVRDGIKLLQELHAIDERLRLSAVGRQLVKLPLDPRLGRMLVEAEKFQCLTEVAIITAALSVQDPRERPHDKQQAADEKHAEFRVEGSDFRGLINLWECFQERKQHLSNNKLRAWCQEHFVSYLRMREWEDIHHQVTEVLKGEMNLRFNEVAAGHFEIHRALLPGLLSNIGFRHDQHEYVGARNLKFYIHPSSCVFKSKPPWIVAAEQVETSKVFGRTVGKIEPEWVEAAAPHLLQRQYYEPHWERKAARVAVFERINLYGLTLHPGRKVNYERINPKEARELFIRHALVQFDWDCPFEFFRHNQRMLAEVEYLQHKGRRVDLLIDEQALFEFYNPLIPADVFSGQSFTRWLRPLGPAAEEQLKLDSNAVLRLTGHGLTAQDYPDTIQLGSAIVPLRYRFEPNHPEDGVTALIPLHQLPQVDADACCWLVPGLLRDKVVALIKSLPKPLRRNFVPVPEVAERCLPRLRFGVGSLTQQLADALCRLGGVQVPVAAFSDGDVPDYLRMNIKLLDEQGEVVAQSRGVGQLQAKHARLAGDQFRQIAAQTVAERSSSAWSFGVLPREKPLPGGSRGYVALADEGPSVAVRICPTAEEARWVHQAGLLRLYQLHMGKDLKALQKDLPLTAQHALLYRNLPAPLWGTGARPGATPLADLAADCLRVVFGQVLLADEPDIRDCAAFAARWEQNRGKLGTAAQHIGQQAAAVMQDYHAMRAKLERLKLPAASLADVRDQLDRMVFTAFLHTTSPQVLREYSRYFKALLFRLDKAVEDPQRDLRRLADLQPAWKQYWSQPPEAPESDPYRWMLEEFRISVFAQQIKTPYPVSAKRLQEAWAARGSVQRIAVGR